MKPAILHCGDGAEFFTEEGCWITELSNGDHDPDLSIARVRVAGGTTTQWHRLCDTIERYVIVKGTGAMQVGDRQPQRVVPGDVVLIPADCPQRITCTSSEDLVFLAICTPRFRRGAYEAMP